MKKILIRILTTVVIVVFVLVLIRQVRMGSDRLLMQDRNETPIESTRETPDTTNEVSDEDPTTIPEGNGETDPAVNTFDTLPVGVSTYSFETADGTRYYKLYAPQSDMSDRPMWLFLHGGGQSMAIIDPEVGDESLRAAADKYNVLLVVPNGTDRDTGSFYSSEDDAGGIRAGQRWHDDTLAGTLPLVEAVDDVAFLTALVQAVQSIYGTDADRTYVSGVSNGGFMTQKLLLETPEYFAAGAAGLALAPVTITENKTSEPTPLLFWLGSEDTQLKELGGTELMPVKLLNPDDTLSWWADTMGASRYVNEGAITEADRFGCYTTQEKYEGTNPVHMYISQGGGHILPSKDYNTSTFIIRRTIGTQCADINALEEILSFLIRFSR